MEVAVLLEILQVIRKNIPIQKITHPSEVVALNMKNSYSNSSYDAMNLFLPGLQLTFSPTPRVNLQHFASSLYIKPISPVLLTFNCSVSSTHKFPGHQLKEVFAGESFEKTEIPYKWRILVGKERYAVHVVFFQHDQLQEAFGEIDFRQQTIQITLEPLVAHETIAIDPLFHPLGPLLMVLLAQHTGGLLIHASGVNDNNRGLLFTGVSGIGKSTMAGLWQKAGARVINDDRLWLHKVDGVWHIFNTPMMHYAQEPAMAPLKAIFLLNQSPKNKLHSIGGASAAMRFMANGIQHFYDKAMTAQHLERVLDITAQVPIYECGFKPDGEIVGEIKRSLPPALPH